MYPEKFERLIEIFEKLPGVGQKTAQRYAFEVLKKEPQEIEEIIDVISKTKEIKKCKICGFLSDEDHCLICKNEQRNHHQICVVASHNDVAAIEKVGSYKGVYHVLGGLISSSKGVYPEDINIDGLLSRIDENTKEIIIAISPTLDGEMTALYLDKILKDHNVLVTRLAHGLPMGSSLDYADDLTLLKAFDNRKSL